VSPDGVGEPVLARRAGRLDGREDPTTRGVQLLVARAGRAKLELCDAIAPETCVRVTVDEPRHRAETAAIELLDPGVIAAERLTEPAHRPGSGDPPVLTQDVRIGENVDLS
jgi:hypothetical protein